MEIVESFLQNVRNEIRYLNLRTEEADLYRIQQTTAAPASGGA